MAREKILSIQPIEWLGDRIRILDQTRLPGETVFIETSDYRVVADAIRRLCVRGAPALGVAGAYAAALAALTIEAQDKKTFLQELHSVVDAIAATRPTAVNLTWALKRIEEAAHSGSSVSDIKQAILLEAQQIHLDEQQATWRLSEFGAALIDDGFTLLTHCNAGALATCGCGTALGVINSAARQGKGVRVYATETRPLLQGARLTAWELMQEGIPVTLITDSMAGHFLSKGIIDAVIVGADRIAANGDVANKIGTYTMAVLAMENGVPFYVAAPVSTIDISLNTGASIPIEERSPDEVTHVQGIRVAAEGVDVANPAFDITPSGYVTAIITEKGVVQPPYSLTLKKLFDNAVGTGLSWSGGRTHA